MTRKRKSQKSTAPRTVRRGPNRLRQFAQGLYRYRVLVVLFMFVLAPAMMGYVLYINQIFPKIQQSLYSKMAALGFGIKDVFVEGRHRTPAKELLQTVGFKQGECILAYDLVKIHSAVKSLPWVHSVAIERRWPDGIYLRLVEHHPLAIWQNQGRFHLVNQVGEVIDQVHAGHYRHLPVVVGKGAPEHAAALLSELNQVPELQSKVTAAIFVGERRWDLLLDQRLTVKLPQKDLQRALRQLVQMEQDHHLSQTNVTTIDLRLGDRSFLYVAQKG